MSIESQEFKFSIHDVVFFIAEEHSVVVQGEVIARAQSTGEEWERQPISTDYSVQWGDVHESGIEYLDQTRVYATEAEANEALAKTKG